MEMTRDAYAEMIKEAALSIGQKAVMAFLTQKFAFLALPIINPIMGLLVGYLLKIAIKETELGAFYNYVDMRVGSQANAFTLAAQKNHQAQLTGTKEEQENAKKELIEAFRKFAVLSN
jgi:hypothetical protein